MNAAAVDAFSASVILAPPAANAGAGASARTMATRRPPSGPVPPVPCANLDRHRQAPTREEVPEITKAAPRRGAHA